MVLRSLVRYGISGRGPEIQLTTGAAEERVKRVAEAVSCASGGHRREGKQNRGAAQKASLKDPRHRRD